MKRTCMAMTLAAVGGVASAQSSVTVSGVVDLAFTHGTASGPGSTSLNAVTSGGNSTSKLVFRGKEDLDGGSSVSFWLEGQLAADTGAAGRPVPAGNQSITAQGTGQTFTRRSTISLTSAWGELRLGRDLTPTLYNLFYGDPFYNVGVGVSLLVIGPSNGLNAGTAYSLVPAGQGTNGPVSRASNQISYFLPSNLGGFYGHASYWLGEAPERGPASDGDGTGRGVRAGYKRGPFDVSASWAKTRYRGTPVGTAAGAPSGDFQTWNLYGSWDFGPARVMAQYVNDSRASTVRAEARGWMLSALMAPVGKHEFKASYGEYKVDGGTGTVPRTREFAIGDVYPLSKRTVLYATLARASNSGGARIAIGGSTIGAGIGNATSTAFDLGLRHSF